MSRADPVGIQVRDPVGLSVQSIEGPTEGVPLSSLEGEALGAIVVVGLSLAAFEGVTLGTPPSEASKEGDAEGPIDSATVGSSLGNALRLCDGAEDGTLDSVTVGL